MSLFIWIILGAISGLIATAIMGAKGSLVWDIILGVIGAIVGGFIFNALGQPGVTGLNLYSVFVSTIGAIVLILVGRLFDRV